MLTSEPGNLSVVRKERPDPLLDNFPRRRKHQPLIGPAALQAGVEPEDERYRYPANHEDRPLVPKSPGDPLGESSRRRSPTGEEGYPTVEDEQRHFLRAGRHSGHPYRRQPHDLKHGHAEQQHQESLGNWGLLTAVTPPVYSSNGGHD